AESNLLRETIDNLRNVFFNLQQNYIFTPIVNLFNFAGRVKASDEKPMLTWHPDGESLDFFGSIFDVSSFKKVALDAIQEAETLLLDLVFDKCEEVTLDFMKKLHTGLVNTYSQGF